MSHHVKYAYVCNTWLYETAQIIARISLIALIT